MSNQGKKPLFKGYALSCFICILIVIFFTRCQQEEASPTGIEPTAESKFYDYPELTADPKPSEDPLSIQVLLDLQNNNDDPWHDASDYMIWSAVKHTLSRVNIGIKPPNRTIEQAESLLYEANSAMDEARDYTLGYLMPELEKLGIPEEDLELEKANDFPVISLNLDDYELLSKLRKLPSVRYIEPTYDLVNNQDTQYLDSGCPADRNERNNIDHREINFAGGSYIIPWQQDAHNIPLAWNQSRGRGVTIGIIDTGTSPNQRLLNDLFDRFYAPRTIQRSWSGGTNDTCGHGTTIAGQIAGPINNNRAIIGIAHEANVIALKVASDVLINTTKKVNRVADAIRLLGANGSVKIINISMGSIFSKKKVHDAIKYAYSRQKLIIAAAGTEVAPIQNGVFPARYEREVLACTGTWFDPNNPRNLTQIDGFNAVGAYVDFAVYLKRRDNLDWAMGMNQRGFDPRAAKGSSSAAATVSGIAALVWAAKPNLSRDQVKQILINSASNANRKSRIFGWGVIDARAAVARARNTYVPLNVSISGPSNSISAPGTYTWTPRVTGSSGRLSYQWYWNNSLVSTSSSYRRYVSRGTHSLRLRVSTSSGQAGSKTISLTVNDFR